MTILSAANVTSRPPMSTVVPSPKTMVPPSALTLPVVATVTVVGVDPPSPSTRLPVTVRIRSFNTTSPSRVTACEAAA